MKLYQKMILIFSAIMLAAFLALSSYMMDRTLMGSRAFTAMRFSNMSTSISRDISGEFENMYLVVRELTDSFSFSSSISQSETGAQGDSSGQLVPVYGDGLQELFRSPLAGQYAQVTFFEKDGRLITSLESEQAQETFDPAMVQDTLSSLQSESISVEGSDYAIIPPTTDPLNIQTQEALYGILAPVTISGTEIGYIAVLNEVSALDRIMEYVDEPVLIDVTAIFGGGQVLFSSQETARAYPSSIAENEMTSWTDSSDEAQLDLFHRYLTDLDLHLYISEDSFINTISEQAMGRSTFTRALLIFLIALAAITAVSLMLTRSIRRLTRRFAHTASDAMLSFSPAPANIITETVTSPRDREIYQLEQEYNQMMLRVRDSMLREMALRESTLQAHLKALQTQINPHFIYNTLNLISAKAMESGNYDIIELCGQFADLLRYSTDTRSQSATLGEEIDNVHNYLAIAKSRYEDALEYTIDVPDTLRGVRVPKLTLQPLVENALTHGFDGTNELRKLKISGSLEEGSLLLEIRDNGTGFSDETLRSLQEQINAIEREDPAAAKNEGHIGLLNTCLRLHYYSRGTMHMRIYNDHGAVIVLTIEQKKAQG